MAVSRLPLSPHLIARLLARKGLGRIALVCGFPDQQSFSTALHDGVVPDAPLHVARWRRVADVVGFPPEMVFLVEPRNTVDRGKAFDEIPRPPQRRAAADTGQPTRSRDKRKGTPHDS